MVSDRCFFLLPMLWQVIKGNDKKTFRREGIDPIKRVFNCVLFSVTRFYNRRRRFKIAGFIYKTLSKKNLSGNLRTVSKRMSLYKTCSGHFFATCVFIFHKTQVLTVNLRGLTGLNLDLVKSYGLRCSLRPRASSANSQKIATNKQSYMAIIVCKSCKS